MNDTQRRALEKISEAALNTKAATPTVGNVELINVRRDVWWRLQLAIGRTFARLRPHSSGHLHQGMRGASDAVNAMLALLLAHDGDDELIDAIVEAGATMNENTDEETLEAIARQVAEILDEGSPLFRRRERK